MQLKPRFEVSPFIDMLVVRTKSKRLTVARGSSLIDAQTGEIEGVTEIAQIIDVDDGQFVKLFTNDLAVFFDLSKPAIRVFAALLKAVQERAIGKDMIFFTHEDPYAREMNVSKYPFYRGINELIEKKFIARHKSDGLYFINPALFFNGDRARFVREYRKVGEKALKAEAFDRTKLLEAV